MEEKNLKIDSESFKPNEDEKGIYIFYPNDSPTTFTQLFKVY